MRWLAVRGARDLARRSSDRRRSVARNRPLAVRRRRRRNPRRASSRGSMSSSGWSWTPSSSGRPQTMHRPGQSGRSERRDRLGQLDRLADGRLEVELVVVGQAERRRARRRPAAAGRSPGRARAGIPPRTGSRPGRRCRAGSGCTRARGPSAGRRAARIPRLVRSRRTRPSIGRGEREVVAEVDRDAVDLVDRGRRRRSSASSPATFQTSGPSSDAARGHRVAAGRLGRLVLPSLAGAVRRRRSVVRRPRASARRSSSRAMPFLMLWRVLTTSPSRPTRTLTAYSSAPRRISSASRCASAMISPALRLGGLGQAALVDEEGGLFLGLGDDPLGLLLGLLDDPLALGVDALGGADLFGDGDPQLVDEAEGGVLVDHDVGRQRQLLAVGDQRLEALDEEDDVDRSALQAACRLGRAGWRAIIARGDVGQRPVERRRARAVAAAAGIIAETSPPKRGDLLDQARADVAVARPRS